MDLNGVRPKSSFDLVRRERAKELTREILSDAADLTTDDEGKHLPSLHKQTTIKSNFTTPVTHGLYFVWVFISCVLHFENYLDNLYH